MTNKPGDKTNVFPLVKTNYKHVELCIRNCLLHTSYHAVAPGMLSSPPVHKQHDHQRYHELAIFACDFRCDSPLVIDVVMWMNYEC